MMNGRAAALQRLRNMHPMMWRSHCPRETLLCKQPVFLAINMGSTTPSRLMTPSATNMGSDDATVNVDSIPGTFAAHESTTASSIVVTTTRDTNTPAVT